MGGKWAGGGQRGVRGGRRGSTTLPSLPGALVFVLAVSARLRSRLLTPLTLLVDAVLLSHDLPELGADLVAALPGLNRDLA